MALTNRYNFSFLYLYYNFSFLYLYFTLLEFREETNFECKFFKWNITKQNLRSS